MMNILPREPGFAELFGSGLSQGILGEQNRRQSLSDQMMMSDRQRAGALQDYQAKQQADYQGRIGLLEKYGQDILNPQNPEERANLLQFLSGGNVSMPQQRGPSASEISSREKITNAQGGLQTIQRMRDIRKQGKLGIGTSWSPFPSTQRDAAEYEQLGKSLISLATNIPIRNRVEFETLAHRLYDPTTTDATAQGIMAAMERIIQNSLNEFGQPNQQFELPPSQQEGLKDLSKYERPSANVANPANVANFEAPANAPAPQTTVNAQEALSGILPSWMLKK